MKKQLLEFTVAIPVYYNMRSDDWTFSYAWLGTPRWVDKERLMTNGTFRKWYSSYLDNA